MTFHLYQILKTSCCKIWGTYTTRITLMYVFLLDISLLQGLHSLNLDVLRCSLTSTKYNLVLLLVHLCTEHDNCQSFTFRYVVFTGCVTHAHTYTKCIKVSLIIKTIRKYCIYYIACPRGVKLFQMGAFIRVKVSTQILKCT